MVNHNIITDEMNKICLGNGKSIYLDLKKRYPERTDRDYDIRLNSLMSALLCLISDAVLPEKVEEFTDLIIEILRRNIPNGKD